MMLPLAAWPLKGQSGLGQQRDRLLLRFIHVCCQKSREKIQLAQKIAGLLGHSQQHFPEEAPGA